MDSFGSLAMNALRLNGFWSITESLAALAQDIRGMLALLGWRECGRISAELSLEKCLNKGSDILA